MSSATLVDLHPVVPPSPSDLKAVFTPNLSHDSDEEDMEDDDGNLMEAKERSFKDSVHGWSESFHCADESLHDPDRNTTRFSASYTQPSDMRHN